MGKKMKDGGKDDKQRPLGVPEEQFNNNWEMLRQQQAEIEALKSEREIMFGFVKSRGEIGQLIMYKAALEQNQ